MFTTWEQTLEWLHVHFTNSTHSKARAYFKELHVSTQTGSATLQILFYSQTA